MKKIFLLFILATKTLTKSCPKPLTIQSENVKKNYNLQNFLGTYYEIAYHDYTQPIGICGCMRSVKTYDPSTKKIKDDFTLNCGNKKGNKNTHTYHNDLSFDLSENPGVFMGKWPLLKFIDFPDTLVDFGPINENGQYSWVLEFQCVEFFGKSVFIGVNFYSSVKDYRFLEDMKNAAGKYGIDEYIYQGSNLTMVDHTGCKYDNKNFFGNFI